MRAHCAVLRECYRRRPQQAYTQQLQLIQLFTQSQSSLDGQQRAMLPVLYRLLADGRRLAQWADRDVAAANRGADGGDAATAQDTTANDGEECQRFREEFTRLVMRLYTGCLHDRAPLDQSKKWGVYALMGLLYRCIFEV